MSTEPRPSTRDLRAPAPSPGPDASAIRKIKRGDRAAFAELFRSEYPLLRVVAARLSSPDHAEEIVQDVFLSLWERRKTLHIDGSPRTYLLSAVRFSAASTVRRMMTSRRHAATVLALHSPPAQADVHVLDQEREAAVAAAIANLPERCRKVFELVRMEGLSYQDTASALGISPKTVDAQMGKALKRLRHDLRAFRAST